MAYKAEDILRMIELYDPNPVPLENLLDKFNTEQQDEKKYNSNTLAIILELFNLGKNDLIDSVTAGKTKGYVLSQKGKDKLKKLPNA